MGEALPQNRLLVCHAPHKFIERLNARYRFWEFVLTDLSVSVYENSVKSHTSRSIRIVNEGIANHEHLVRGRHSRNFEEFKKKMSRWLPETAF